MSPAARKSSKRAAPARASKTPAKPASAGKQAASKPASAGKKAATASGSKSAPQKARKAPAQRRKGLLSLRVPAKASGRRASGDRLQKALIGLHAWEAVSGPHVTGLGQMQMWVTAYTDGVLTPDDDDVGPQGRIFQ